MARFGQLRQCFKLEAGLLVPCIRRANRCPNRQYSPKRLQSMKAVSKEVVSTEKAPAAVGPYSQAIKAGDLVFLSGQVGLIPGTKDLAGDDVKSQADQALQNLGAVLEAAGSSFANVTKTTVLLTSMSDFATVNEVYSKYLPEKPARACYAVKELPLGAKVEIEAIAISASQTQAKL